MVTSAYRNGRYGRMSRCQWQVGVNSAPDQDPEPEGAARLCVRHPPARQLAWRPRAISSATFWPPFLPISSKCSCPYFSLTASPPILPIRP